MPDIGFTPEIISSDLSYLETVPAEDRFLEIIKNPTAHADGNFFEYAIPGQMQLTIRNIIVDYAESSLGQSVKVSFANKEISALRARTDAGHEVGLPIRPYTLVGDGNRRLALSHTSERLNGTVYVVGYLSARENSRSDAVDSLAATPQPDSVMLSWDTPLSNGGMPITQFRVRRALVLDGNRRLVEPVTLATFAPEDTESERFTYADTAAEAGTDYFYDVTPITTFSADEGLGKVSDAVSGRINTDSPGAVTGFVAAPATSAVELSWAGPPNTANSITESFEIQRSTDRQSGFVSIADVPGSETTYTDAGATPATSYHYRIRAKNRDGNAGPTWTYSQTADGSASVTVQYPPPTFIVVELTTDVEDIRTHLRWRYDAELINQGLSGFVIRRSEDDINFSDIATIPGEANQYTDRAIKGDTTYYYRVTALFGGIQSAASDSILVRVPAISPAPPQNFRIKSIDGSSVTLQWDRPLDDGGTAIAGYDVQASTHEEFAELEPATMQSSGTELEFAGLDVETRYYFRARARTSDTNIVGRYSDTISEFVSTPVFGDGHDGELVLAANQTVTVSENMHYTDVTLNANSRLIVNNCILRANGTLLADSTSQITVNANGCAPGTAGMTIPGEGGFETGHGGLISYDSQTRNPRSNVPGQAAVLIPPTLAQRCTSINAAEELQEYFMNPREFNTRFQNSIRGGAGSDGTAAAASGDGGQSGTSAFLRTENGRRVHAVGGKGGRGGKGADGADGAYGGGKFGLFARRMSSAVSIVARGNPGINGNKGTADTGDAGAPGAGNATAGASGQDASSDGTLGSASSQGGFVFVLYDTITDSAVSEQDISDAIDVSADLGGFHGADSSSGNDVTAERAATGPAGLAIVRSAASYGVQQ